MSYAPIPSAPPSAGAPY
jgi:hypothetical protein